MFLLKILTIVNYLISSVLVHLSHYWIMHCHMYFFFLPIWSINSLKLKKIEYYLYLYTKLLLYLTITYTAREGGEFLTPFLNIDIQLNVIYRSKLNYEAILGRFCGNSDIRLSWQFVAWNESWYCKTQEGKNGHANGCRWRVCKYIVCSFPHSICYWNCWRCWCYQKICNDLQQKT